MGGILTFFAFEVMQISHLVVENVPEPTYKVLRTRYTATEKVAVIDQIKALRLVGGTLNGYCKDMGYDTSMVRRRIRSEDAIRRMKEHLPASSNV